MLEAIACLQTRQSAADAESLDLARAPPGRAAWHGGGFGRSAARGWFFGPVEQFFQRNGVVALEIAGRVDERDQRIILDQCIKSFQGEGTFRRAQLLEVTLLEEFPVAAQVIPLAQRIRGRERLVPMVDPRSSLRDPPRPPPPPHHPLAIVTSTL